MSKSKSSGYSMSAGASEEKGGMPFHMNATDGKEQSGGETYKENGPSSFEQNKSRQNYGK